MQIPSSIAKAAKRTLVWPRYWQQMRAARQGFIEHGHLYPQTTLFIAGLPKAGTTWLKNMVASYPGFAEVLIPEATAYECRTGGSHNYELPADLFGRFERRLVVSKMHVGGSAHNAHLLREAGIPYVVLYRDLRDVAVSYYHYVRKTPWHPDHTLYRHLDVQDGLARFAEITLGAYVRWVRSWLANRDPERSIVLRYEDLLADTAGSMQRIAKLFDLDASPATIGATVGQHRFTAGVHTARKGIAGDWRNHFDASLARMYEVRMRSLTEPALAA